MTVGAPPERMAVLWSPEARSAIRAIDHETAMQILYCIDRYLASRTGDVKKLKPPFAGFRFRCGRLSRVLRSHGREHDRNYRRS